jgi:acylphosphatase
MKTVRIIVKGKVQGVFYRASAKEEAAKLGLNGWVANRADGSVEAIASGEKSSVEKFIEWCRKGPVRAQVQEIIVEDAEAYTATGFIVKRG